MAKPKYSQTAFVDRLTDCFARKDNIQLTSLLGTILGAYHSTAQKSFLRLAFDAVDTLAGDGRLFRAAHCLKHMALTLPEATGERVHVFQKALQIADKACHTYPTPLFSIAALYAVPKGLSDEFQTLAGHKAYAMAETALAIRTQDLRGLAALYNLAAVTLPDKEERITNQLFKGVAHAAAHHPQDLKGLTDLIRTTGELLLTRGQPVGDLGALALDAGVAAVKRHSSDHEGLLDLFSLASLYTAEGTPANTCATDMVIWLADGQDGPPPKLFFSSLIRTPSHQQKPRLTGPQP